MLRHKRFVTFSGMSGAQAAAEATEATAEILVESYLDLVGEGEVVRLDFDKNGMVTLFLLIPQGDGRGKLSQGFSVFLPLCLRMVRETHWFF